MIKRILLSILASLVVVFLFWTGGFDFHRGEVGFFCALLSLFVGGLTFYAQERSGSDGKVSEKAGRD